MTLNWVVLLCVCVLLALVSGVVLGSMSAKIDVALFGLPRHLIPRDLRHLALGQSCDCLFAACLLRHRCELTTRLVLCHNKSSVSRHTRVGVRTSRKNLNGRGLRFVTGVRNSHVTASGPGVQKGNGNSVSACVTAVVQKCLEACDCNPCFARERAFWRAASVR
jgi:hypothetical protein